METFTRPEISAFYTARLPELKQRGQEWRGPCPVHQGERDSFAVEAETGRAFCHSTCQRGWDIISLQRELTGKSLQAARAEVLRLVGRPAGDDRKAHGPCVEAEYSYTDKTGKLSFVVERRRLSNGQKDFRVRRPGPEGGWIWRKPAEATMLPYNLPKVLLAETVYVVEGEKDVHTLGDWQLVATTNAFGAKKWRPEHARYLKGKHVIILPDNDADGEAHRQIVAATLVGVAASVKAVDLPGLPEKGDVTDWRDIGHTKQELLSLVTLATPTDTFAGDRDLTYTGQPYSVHAGSLYVWRDIHRNHIRFEIANFVARITADQVVDDGEERYRVFTVEASLSGRTVTVEIPARDFKSMNWVAEKLGGMAIVKPGQTEHARAAIQTLSGKIPTRDMYSCTGWREIGGENYYLHGGGGIGVRGNCTDICMSLQDKLPHYRLPDPPSGANLIGAIRSSLQMLDVTLDRLTFPVYASIWRAILGPATFSIHLAGSTGAGKSQLAALAQQHFGPNMDTDNLPASWLGTANATAMLAFYAKDALLVVDDFVPTGNAASQQRLQGEADKLLRAQGNSSGRRRLHPDGRLHGNRPPRGLILSTGEDTPRGKSLNARLVLLRFPKGAMDWKKLSVCQERAASGEFAAAASGFVQWLSNRLHDVQQEMRNQRFIQRGRVSEPSCLHMRTPENLDALHFGLATFLNFAQSVGAISQAEAQALVGRAEAAFRETEIGEARKHIDTEPSRIFLRLIRSAITMGKAYLAAPNGAAPEGEKPWGWCVSAGTNEKQGRGTKIGWVKDDDVFLLPDAAHAVACRLAQEQGEVLPGSVDAIKRDLKEQGLLAKTDEKRRTIAVRRTLEGEVQDVLFIKYGFFYGASMESADIADNCDIGDETASELAKAAY